MPAETEMEFDNMLTNLCKLDGIHRQTYGTGEPQKIDKKIELGLDDFQANPISSCVKNFETKNDLENVKEFPSKKCETSKKKKYLQNIAASHDAYERKNAVEKDLFEPNQSIKEKLHKLEQDVTQVS